MTSSESQCMTHIMWGLKLHLQIQVSMILLCYVIANWTQESLKMQM